MNFIMNPILSTTSDRTRTRWGRRIPFLVTATPFVAGFVILLGWTPQIAELLHGAGFLPSVRLQTLGILLLAFCAVLFQFFNLIVGSIYYYIFADVIPHRFIGRYMAAMNIGGMVTQLVFNLWVMPSVTDHLPWVYTVVGITYFVTFMLMCVFVKEGKYPSAERPENEGLPLWLRIYNWVAALFPGSVTVILFHFSVSRNRRSTMHRRHAARYSICCLPPGNWAWTRRSTAK